MQTRERETSVITALLLAACLIFMAVPVVSHADSIPPAQGNLYIHKYLMEDLAGAMDTSNGEALGEVSIPTDATPLDGIDFDVYSVDIPTDGALAGVYPASAGAIALTPTTNPTKITDALGHEYAVTYVKTVTTGAGGQPTGVALAGNLARGVYLVVEQESSKVASPAAPFVVSVPMTNPDGDGWLADVHVYPKNESMEAKKAASTPSVSIGDEVTFTITPSVPTDIASAEKYDIVDTLDAALDYDEDGSVVVKGADSKEGLATADAGYTLEDDYTVTYDKAKRELRVSFTEDGIKKLDGVKFLAVSFKTTVNAVLLGLEAHTVSNTATVDFTNSYKEEKKIYTNAAKIHTGRIVIDKRDAANGQVKLAGAKFKIAATKQDAENEENFLRISGGAILTPGAVGYDAAPDYEVTTNNAGVATFAGIADFVDKDGNGAADDGEYLSYYLVETQAPDGYNLLTEPFKVTFDGTAVASNSYTVTALIKNNAGFTLPKTGGMGTFLFTLGGIALMGAAALIYVTRRRKDRKEER